MFKGWDCSVWAGHTAGTEAALKFPNESLTRPAISSISKSVTPLGQGSGFWEREVMERERPRPAMGTESP